MTRDLAWYPGVHSDLNHLYDMATGVAICGSTARMPSDFEQFTPTGFKKHVWHETDCPECIIVADKIHNDERDAEEEGD